MIPTRWLAAVLAVVLVGCSFTLGAPTRNPAGQPPDCARSAAGRKLLDFLGGVTSLYLAYGFDRKAEDESDACSVHDDCSPGSRLPALGFLTLGLAYFSAILYGYERTEQCAAA